MPPSLSVCFPVFNEAENLPRLHADLVHVLSGLRQDRLISQHEIIFVDDGSTDRTADLLAQLAVEDPSVRVITSPRNHGYGRALKQGLTAASMDYVFFSDSDNQFDLAEIRLLLPLMAEHAFVIGYRRQRKDPVHRRTYARLFNWLVCLRFGTLFRDVNCAFKIFRREALQGVELASDGALVNAELLSRLIQRGHRYTEVAVQHFPRQHGTQSGGDLRVILRMLKEIASIGTR